MKNIIALTKQAFYDNLIISDKVRSEWLTCFNQLIQKNTSDLIEANRIDLKEQKEKISISLYQRLSLSEEKIQSIISGIQTIAEKKDPLGQKKLIRQLDENLLLEKITVPIGLIAVIFESRPDVIPQILSLVFKSGNVVILKGGKEAINTNKAFMNIVQQVNSKFPTVCPHWSHLIESRTEVSDLLNCSEQFDLIIPRGSNQLVQMVLEKSKAPVLGHADGVCHIYVDKDMAIDKTICIVQDAKCQYPSACNSLETLLLHQNIAQSFFQNFLKISACKKIKINGCLKTKKLFPHFGDVDNWSHEYGDLEMSVKIVENIREAIDHINYFGSHHTDAILSENKSAQELFLKEVDSASVIINASTRFADGFRYGFGAEVGISTSKTHARGPVGIEGLLSYKYLLRGNGQVVAQYLGKNARSFEFKDLL